MKKHLILLLEPYKVDSEMYEDIADTVVVERVDGIFWLDYDLISNYDKIVIVYRYAPTRDLVLELLRRLENTEIVYVPDTYEGGGISKRILYKLSSLLASIDCNDCVLSRIIAFKTGILTESIPIRVPLILPSILTNIKFKGKMDTYPCEYPKKECGPIEVGLVASSLIRIGLWSGQLLRMLKFSFLGIVTLLLSEFLLWYITKYVGFEYYISALFASQITNTVAYILNEFIVFTNIPKRISSVVSRFLKFMLASWVSALVGWTTLVFLTEIFDIPYLISNIFGIIVGSIILFLLSFENIWVGKISLGKVMKK